MSLFVESFSAGRGFRWTLSASWLSHMVFRECAKLCLDVYIWTLFIRSGDEPFSCCCAVTGCEKEWEILGRKRYPRQTRLSQQNYPKLQEKRRQFRNPGLCVDGLSSFGILNPFLLTVGSFWSGNRGGHSRVAVPLQDPRQRVQGDCQRSDPVPARASRHPAGAAHLCLLWP